MKECPKCSAKIPMMKTKTKFKCPACGSEIRTNELKLMIIGFTLWFFVIGPVIGILLSESYIIWIIADLTAGLIIFFLLFAVFLKIELRNSSFM